jgi:enoyl-CoA hydratase/3-hydroxyacyl-CoA dehydrogenase
LSVPPVLGGQRDKGESFPIKFVKEDKHGGLAYLTFNRPGAMNALNEESMNQFEEAFDRAVVDDDVQGVVLRGAGRAFVAGADIRFLIKAIEAKEFDRIRKFTERGHRILNKVDRCPKPVMAQLDGEALGLGFEIALAADYIIATPKASVAFPETGVGIYPGLGGTQRTARRIGIGLTRYLVLSGDHMNANAARHIRLMDAVVERKDLHRVFNALLERGPRGEEAWGVVPAMEDVLARHSEVWKEVAASFRTLDIDTALAGKAAVGGDVHDKAKPIVEHGLRSVARRCWRASSSRSMRWRRSLRRRTPTKG